MRLTIVAGLTAFSMALVLPASAQNQGQNQGTPEQRIERLERQLRQVQSRVFVRGQPADTAGFVYDPAATQSSVTAINDRLSALERQMADILRLSEENGNRLRTMESDNTRLRAAQEERITALERRAAEPAASPPVTDVTMPGPSATTPQLKTNGASPATIRPSGSSAPVSTAVENDPGEEAYSQGFRLWQSGQYREAINALRGFIGVYPKHRRVSWANNLIGRSLLDSGQPRPAAEALLANYRSNPRGERAPDSLYYLGQAVMKLGQPGQACKAYAELEDVYRGKIRPDLAKLLPPAKAQAGCS